MPPSVVTFRVCGMSVDREGGARDAPDGQAHAVERHRALRRDEARKLRRRLDLGVQRTRFLGATAHGRDAVHVAGDQVAAERRSRGNGRLEIDDAAGREPPERRARERLA